MELEVLVAGVDVTNIIVSFGLAVSSVDLPGAVVAQLVHQAVLHGGEDKVVHSVTVLGNVVLLIDVGVHSTTDPHHPQELVDIVA